MGTYANHAFEIPFASILKHCPKEAQEIQTISELDSVFTSYNDNMRHNFDEIVNRSDDYEDYDKKTLRIIDNNVTAIIKHFKDVFGLDIGFDCRGADEDTDIETMQTFYWFCNNAYTLNPVFTDLGGELVLWTSQA